MDNLHVTHRLQRRRIGSALLGCAAWVVMDSGTTQPLYLWVLEQNTAAQAFYTALGGRIVGQAFVIAPGGVPGRINGIPRKLRVAWPDVNELLRRL